MSGKLKVVNIFVESTMMNVCIQCGYIFFEMFGAFVVSVSVFQSCVHWVDDLFFFYPFSCFLVACWCVFLG